MVQVLWRETDWGGSIFYNWRSNGKVQPNVAATIFPTYDSMLVALLKDRGLPVTTLERDKYNALKTPISDLPDHPDEYKDGFYYIFVVGNYGTCVRVPWELSSVPLSASTTTTTSDGPPESNEPAATGSSDNGNEKPTTTA